MEKNTSLTTLAINALGEQLTCAICLGEYTYPKVLPCQHSFCLQCIQGLPRSSTGEDDTHYSISCPQCRTVCLLPDTGAEYLPTPYYINQLFDLEQQFENRKKTQEVCLIHNEPMKLHCKTCEELICLECALTNVHSSHQYSRINKVYDSHKQEIQERMELLREKITRFNTMIENLSIRESELQQNAIDIKSKVNQHSEEAINSIITGQNQLLLQLDNILAKKLQSINAQKQKAEDIALQLKHCEDMIATNLKEWSECKLVRDRSSVMKGLNTMINMHSYEVFQPIEQADIKFTASLPTFGDIHYSTQNKRTVVLRTVYVGEASAAAQLTLKTDRDKPFCVPLLMVKATVNSPSRKKHTIECNVTQEHNSSTYQLSFTPTVRGEHYLNIFVGGVKIKGSPFIVTAIAKTNSLGQIVNATYGFKCPWGVGVFNDGSVVVAENGNNSVAILGEDGRHKERLIIDSLKFPRGVAVTNDQSILITDSHSVIKVSLEGERQAMFSHTKPLGSLDYPVGVAVQPITGHVFVADSKNNRVLVLNSQLEFCYVLLDSQCWDEPSDIAFDQEGYIYVAEFNSHCIKKISPDGVSMGTICSKGKKSGSLLKPISIAIHKQKLYVCESGKSRVSVFDLEGHLLHFFDETDSGFLGITVNQQGYLVVSDYCNGRVLIY